MNTSQAPENPHDPSPNPNPYPRWRKSSYSVGEGQCVEVASWGGLVRLRESDDPSAVIGAAPAVWAAFVRGVKAGSSDG
ncbi:DUF397 domain-containing protein [Streptomyces sparsogenes]|uniref:DUF397 domain-containing protein n=1 Tax=Streptomyces sparsogenes DSM 40356 TaxID=1331668 RepID=A0A1R1S6P4_9ACTN|nr:DUF397 domain-containing protein [Streptomyces sparsogenes]OMI33852.1 hypothetical protein SPAR_39346 [Streptomyces sparsogenes DSM 40356]